MNLSRLALLGMLARLGPMHGHRIRQEILDRGAEGWAGISPGAVNRELRECENESLIEKAGTERVGNRPVRTVYRITELGRTTLDDAVEGVLSSWTPRVDPLSVALVFAGDDRPRRLLAATINRRAVAVDAERERLAAERRRGGDFLEPDEHLAEALSFRRAELLIEAERAWQRECAGWFARPAR